MTGMSEAVMPIAGGMEIPLRFAPLGVGNIVPEQVFHHGAPQEEKSQWGQFEEYSQSIAAVAKSLGDGIERNSVVVGSSCPAKESSVFDRMSASDVEYVRTVEPSPQSVKAVEPSRVQTVEKPQAGAIESSRAEKPDIAEAVEVKVSEKPVVKAVEPSRVQTVEKPQSGAIESSRAEKPNIAESAEVKAFEKPIAKAVEPSRVQTVEKPQAGAIESPRTEKPNIAEAAEVKVSEKPIVKAVESPRTDQTKHGSVQELKIPGVETPEKAEAADSEDVIVRKAENVNDRAVEGLGVQVHEKSHGQESGKSGIQAADVAGVRMSQNVYVQTPERVSVSRLVETVVETMAVTPALATGGDGELRIRLKSDILDGSSVKMEVKGGELKIVVVPASRAAEEILLKAQESFQNQLAERVTAWRINVGIAAFDSRQSGRNKLEEES